MRVLYINNDGGGFAGYVDIAEGLTVGSFVDGEIEGSPESYLIRVNRQPVAADYVLQEGDRITVTPTKIHGAYLTESNVRTADGSHPYLEEDDPVDLSMVTVDEVADEEPELFDPDELIFLD